PAPVSPQDPPSHRDAAVEPSLPFVVVDGRSTRVSDDGTILVSCGKVHTLREGNVERSLMVPCDGASGQPSLVRTAPRSVGLTAVGVSLMTVGAMSFLGGVGMGVLDPCYWGPCPVQDRAEHFMAAGAVLVLLGLPFVIIGQSRVPVADPASAT